MVLWVVAYQSDIRLLPVLLRGLDSVCEKGIAVRCGCGHCLLWGCSWSVCAWLGVALLVGAEQTELDLAYIHIAAQDCGTVQHRVPCCGVVWCGGVSLDPSVLYTHRPTRLSGD